jgi:hypothetical protein
VHAVLACRGIARRRCDVTWRRYGAIGPRYTELFNGEQLGISSFESPASRIYAVRVADVDSVRDTAAVALQYW